MHCLSEWLIATLLLSMSVCLLRTKEEIGRQHHEMDKPVVQQVSEGGGEQEGSGENWLKSSLGCPDDSCG